MLKLCGETEEKLAQELLQFELQTERDVVEPLYVLAEVKLAHVLRFCTLFIFPYITTTNNLVRRWIFPTSRSREST